MNGVKDNDLYGYGFKKEDFLLKNILCIKL